MATHLLTALEQCSSGKELIAKGYGDDLAVIAQLDVDACVPLLTNGAYVAI